MSAVQQWGDKKKKRYGALCHKLPNLVLRSGLAQAVGFLSAKAGGNADSPEGTLLAHFANHVGGQTNTNQFLQNVNAAPLPDYMRLTRATLDAALWYKRYAQSLLGVDPTETGDA